MADLKIRLTDEEAKAVKRKALELDSSIQQIGYALFMGWLQHGEAQTVSEVSVAEKPVTDFTPTEEFERIPRVDPRELTELIAGLAPLSAEERRVCLLAFALILRTTTAKKGNEQGNEEGKRQRRLLESLDSLERDHQQNEAIVEGLRRETAAIKGNR